MYSPRPIRAAGARGRGPAPERLEERLQHLGRDGPGEVLVGDGDLDCVALHPEGHRHRAGGRTVLDGVPEEIGEDLGQPVAVPLTPDFPLERGLEPAPGVRGLNLGEGLPQHDEEIDPAWLDG